MNYIGVTGHRGSGKTSVSFLLGNILDNLEKGLSKDEIYENYKIWCEELIDNDNIIRNAVLDNVYFDEFGDMPKAFVSNLLSIDMNMLYNDVLKDKMFVNMKDFKLYPRDKVLKVLTANELVEYTKSHSPKKWEDIYISLRNFAEYLSVNIMQKTFGSDVWVKTRRQNDLLYGEIDVKYTVFSDIKTTEEINYIKEKNGILIRTINKSKKKSNRGIVNTDNIDVDFIINTDKDLIDLFEEILKISIEIYGKHRQIS